MSYFSWLEAVVRCHWEYLEGTDIPNEIKTYANQPHNLRHCPQSDRTASDPFYN